MSVTDSTPTPPRPRIVVRLAADGTLSTGDAISAGQGARRKEKKPRKRSTLYDRFRMRLARDLNAPDLDRTSIVAGCPIRFLREHLQGTFREGMWWTSRKGWVVARIEDVPHDHRNDRAAVSSAFRWDNLTTMYLQEWESITANRRWAQNRKQADAVLCTKPVDKKDGVTITSPQLNEQKQT